MGILSIVNWRREGLFVCLAGLETCWTVGCSRILLRHPESGVTGLAWWSVFILFMIALTIARTLGRLELQRREWIISGIALFSSLLLLPGDMIWGFQILNSAKSLDTSVMILSVLFGLWVWFRAFQLPARAGDVYATLRQFQLGVLVMIGLAIASLPFSASITDLVIAYFGFGLLSTALTRMEDVARSESGSAVSLDRKWMMTLAVTLAVAAGGAWLAVRVLTIDVARWLLAPFVFLFQALFFLLAVVVYLILSPLLSLIRWGVHKLDLKSVEKELETLGTPDFPEFAEEASSLNQGGMQVLEIALIVVVIVVALWIVVRAFRRWRVQQYATPGGVRETVASDKTLAEDLIGFFQDRWQHLKNMADLRRLLWRRGIDSARAIYANLLDLMAAANLPRHLEQTPYEYEPVAERALPARRAEITDITQAYVRAHYGEADINAEELSRLQEAWERVRADGEELIALAKSGVGRDDLG